MIGATAAALAIAGGVVAWQLRLAPRAAEAYTLSPHLAISTTDRLKADAVFAVYHERKAPGDPVAASPYLFRYMDYRSMYWMDRLAGRPKLVWVLLDLGPNTSGTPAYGNYEMVAHEGRFVLFHQKSPAAK